MAKSDTTPTFQALGQGITWAMQDGNLVLAIPVTDAALSAARPSSTGKTRVVASTGGHVMIPGLSGVKLNLTLTTPNAA